MATAAESPDAAPRDPKLEELAAIVSEIRERVAQRGGSGSIALPDLMPLLHARDAAQAKVAAIGAVNPRPGGPLNSAIQGVKGLIARALGWFVRDQIVFNREVVRSIEATIEALNEANRALKRIEQVDEARRETADLASHWQAFRAGWEHKLVQNEAQFLRSVADLQSSYNARLTVLEAGLRDQVKAQHSDYLRALDAATVDIQKRLWDDLEKIRREYETIIHHELRLVRQRAAFSAPPANAPSANAAAPAIDIDWLKFAEKFRGSEEYVRKNQRIYAERFAGRRAVLDLGCGRGEFLELMRECNIGARGIEASQELVGLCRGKGLDATQADLFEHLESLADASLDGIFCSQVVEHLQPGDVVRLVRLAQAKLARGGALVVETPNPECLAIFATHFYLDPSHVRPIPPALMAFYLEESGFGRVEVVRLQPAAESLPPVNELPASVREAFFGSMDYFAFGVKLS
jgi:O-antigen chain-terminating methyltransferase